MGILVIGLLLALCVLSIPYLLAHAERTPITGRLRFNFISEKALEPFLKETEAKVKIKKKSKI